jgi:hypothetical protein
MVWKEFLQRSQTVEQFVVVAKAAFDVAEPGDSLNRAVAVGAELSQCVAAFGSPAHVLPVNPKVNDVNRGIIGRGCKVVAHK